MTLAIFFGNVMVNYPHYAATYYRVYPRKGETTRYVAQAVWTPLLLLPIMVACGVFAQKAMPWLLAAYLLFSGWHYCGQSYGIGLIFAGKAGAPFSEGEKWILRWPIYSSFIFSWLYLQSDAAPALPPLFGFQLPSLHLPNIGWQITLGLTIAGILAYIGVCVKRRQQAKPAPPMGTHVLLATHLVWFLCSVQYPAFLAVVPFFHCLQYLVVTTYCEAKESGGSQQPANFLRSGRFRNYYVIQVVTGSLLFVGVPYGLSLLHVAPFLLLSALATCFLNIHHFVLDGAIWKIRKPAVRQQLGIEASTTVEKVA